MLYSLNRIEDPTDVVLIIVIDGLFFLTQKGKRGRELSMPLKIFPLKEISSLPSLFILT
jgi:hypothetical protein